MFIKSILASVSILGVLTTLGVGLLAPAGVDTYTISPADFTVENDSEKYFNMGFSLSTYDSTVQFYAPVHLPEGVTVTRITFYWNDVSGVANAELILNSSSFLNAHVQEASVWTTGNTYSDTSSSLATSVVIQEDRFYYLTLVLPINIVVYGVELEYTNPAYLSIIRK